MDHPVRHIGKLFFHPLFESLDYPPGFDWAVTTKGFGEDCSGTKGIGREEQCTLANQKKDLRIDEAWVLVVSDGYLILVRGVIEFPNCCCN